MRVNPEPEDGEEPGTGAHMPIGTERPSDLARYFETIDAENGERTRFTPIDVVDATRPHLRQAE